MNFCGTTAISMQKSDQISKFDQFFIEFAISLPQPNIITVP